MTRASNEHAFILIPLPLLSLFKQADIVDSGEGLNASPSLSALLTCSVL